MRLRFLCCHPNPTFGWCVVTNEAASDILPCFSDVALVMLVVIK